MANSNSRIFVTHASVDKELAEVLVDALLLGANLPAGQVFCSSLEGMRVPTGQDFVAYIRSQLKNTRLVVLLITPPYLESAFCMWELGAAWIRNVDTFPILVEPVRPDQLKGPLSNRHVSKLDKAGLNELHDRICNLLPDATRSTAVWEAKRNDLLGTLPQVMSSINQRWAETEAERTRRSARYVDALEHIHQAFHLLRDASFVRIASGADDAVRRGDEFLSLVKQSVDSMAKAFRVVTGAGCRVTVKEVLMVEGEMANGEGSIQVRDFCRSTGTTRSSLKRRGPLDLVADNTDFETLFEGPGRYFFSNDLVSLYDQGSYKNSHWPSGVPQPLPYRATIVWPIRKELGSPLTADKLGSISDWQDIVGFLCVDTTQAGAFCEDSEVQLGACFADTLFHVLRAWDPVPAAATLRRNTTRGPSKRAAS